MKDRNELIYRIRQIIGVEKEDGFYTPVEYNGEIIEVPNFLFRDGPAEYPEIRISPLLSDGSKAHPLRIKGYGRNIRRKIYSAIFQIDIYATNLALVNKIDSAVKRRIDYFYDIDTATYGYDKKFKLIDEEKTIYHHKGYNTNDFQIIGVYIKNFQLTKVFDKKELNKKNTYYIDKTGLYINTDLNIKMLQISVIVDGLAFPDGETAYSKGIIKMRRSNKRTLSELEKDQVERITYELNISYIMDQVRNTGPVATDIIVDSD